MAMLDKYCADLFSTQHLAVLIKYLLNQNTIFLPPLFWLYGYNRFFISKYP